MDFLTVQHCQTIRLWSKESDLKNKLFFRSDSFDHKYNSRPNNFRTREVYIIANGAVLFRKINVFNLCCAKRQF